MPIYEYRCACLRLREGISAEAFRCADHRCESCGQPHDDEADLGRRLSSSKAAAGTSPISRTTAPRTKPPRARRPSRQGSEDGEKPDADRKAMGQERPNQRSRPDKKVPAAKARVRLCRPARRPERDRAERSCQRRGDGEKILHHRAPDLDPAGHHALGAESDRQHHGQHAAAAAGVAAAEVLAGLQHSRAWAWC